jgi:hypothetical protein
MVELLSDFLFVDGPSQANTLAVLLLSFVRPMIDGPTTQHRIGAPTQGTGKTLLAQAIGFPVLGRVPDSMAEGRDDDKWRERLTAMLMQALAFVQIDNLHRPLDSGGHDRPDLEGSHPRRHEDGGPFGERLLPGDGEQHRSVEGICPSDRAHPP